MTGLLLASTIFMTAPAAPPMYLTVYAEDTVVYETAAEEEHECSTEHTPVEDDEDDVMFSAFVTDPEYVEDGDYYIAIDEDGEEVRYCEIEGEVDLFPEDYVEEDEEEQK